MEEHPHAGSNAVRALFQTAFQADPDVIASAPGRVNLIGEHLDYNGGEVLPIAITRRTWVAMRARAGAHESRAVSGDIERVGHFDASAPARAGAWWDYVSGVAAMIRADGHVIPQFDIAVISDVPAGAGLSSSAALEVATAAALGSLIPVHLNEPTVLARISWRAETSFVGVECGIMDQFASALGVAGHAIHLWCDTEATELVPFAESVLVFDTAVPRSLRSSAFNERRRECEQAFARLRAQYPTLTHLAAATPDQVRAANLPEPLGRRALHVAEENRRVQQVVEALRAGKPVPGELFYRSHESLRTLYECSSPELDWFVSHAAAIDGVRGARLTGAGWGGCAIAIGDATALANAVALLTREYTLHFGHPPRAWCTEAGDGVQTSLGAAVSG